MSNYFWLLVTYVTFNVQPGYYSDQLSLLPSAGREIRIGQIAVFCGREGNRRSEREMNTMHTLFYGVWHPLLFTFIWPTFFFIFKKAVARPSVCLSSVGNVRAPYSDGSNFPQYFYGIRYLGHPLTSTENFTEIVPGEPLRRGSWT